MLEEFLDSIQAEARPDGQNLGFSVDLAAQARKLETFQAQQPSLWLLKGIQAAVSSGADRVEIQTTRSALQLRFFPGPESSPLELYQSPTGWSAHLRTALLAALSQNPSGFSLFRGGVPLFEQGQPDSKLYEGIQLVVCRPRRPFWKFADPDLAALHQSLAWRAALCPIPVVVDGRTINQPLLEKVRALGSGAAPTGWGEGSIPYYWLAERIWPSLGAGGFALACPALRSGGQIFVSDGRASLGSAVIYMNRVVSVYQHLELEAEIHEIVARPEDIEVPPLSYGVSILPGVTAEGRTQTNLALALNLSQKQKLFYFSRLAYIDHSEVSLSVISTRFPQSHLDLPGLSCARWLGLSAAGRGGGGLFYLLDGILLDPVPGGRYAGTTAIVSDSSLITDLSQCQVVRDSRVASDLKWLEEEEARLLESCRAGISSVSEGEEMRIPLSVRTHWRNLLKPEPKG